MMSRWRIWAGVAPTAAQQSPEREAILNATLQEALTNLARALVPLVNALAERVKQENKKWA